MYTWELTQLGCKDIGFGVELLLSRSTLTTHCASFLSVQEEVGALMVSGNALILPSEK